MILFIFLQISLISSLMEDRQILTSVSAFNPLKHVVLAEVDEENPASQRYVVGKGR